MALASSAAAEDQGISVYYNDEKIQFDIDTVNENGTTMVQFRPIFEKLGLSVNWDEKSKKITGTNYDSNVELRIGNKQAIVNGSSSELQVAPTNVPVFLHMKTLLQINSIYDGIITDFSLRWVIPMI